MRNDHNFFLGRMYFISNGGYQNTFVYESILNILELKNIYIKVLTMFLVGNQMKYIILNLRQCTQLL